MEMNNDDLRNLAQAAAENRDIEEPKETVENEDIGKTSPLSDVLSKIATEEPKVQMVDDVAVVVAPPTKSVTEEPANLQAPEALAPTPKPVAVGLDESALETPKVESTKIPSSSAPVEANTKNYHYNEDGSYSDDQNQAMETFLEYVPANERPDIARSIFDTGIAEENMYLRQGLDENHSRDIANRAVEDALTKANEKYKKEHPNQADIVINKTDNPDSLGLTKEEHEKLERVKKVRLVLVEDKDLANIVIERPDEEHKADYIKSIDGSISKYHVPLPMLGDFVGFKGAQIVQLINVVNYDDSTLTEIINMKASLIYDKLVNGSILKRFDETGKSIMPYTEFINKYPYQDLNIGLYGILCASSMEDATTSLTCERCKHTWNQRYNLKSILKFRNLSDFYKKRVGDILAYKNNDIELNRLYEERRQVRRYKSPFSGNIYDLSYPTVARALDILKRIDEEDAVMNYIGAIALYVSRILVFNSDKNTYVEVTAEEVQLILDTLLSCSNDDMNMLANQIRTDFYYDAEFELNTVCPSCKAKADIPLNIENLIFLKAQDSVVEIEQ